MFTAIGIRNRKMKKGFRFEMVRDQKILFEKQLWDPFECEYDNSYYTGKWIPNLYK